MPREKYQERLTQLRDDVLYMSEIVAERLRMGMDALAEKDEELAHRVIEEDAEVNQLYLELEQDCIDLLALQQPVAGDLRFVAATFKIITDLERIGDLATNLGEHTLQAERDVFSDVDVQRIGEATLDMLDDAMTAYAEENADACFAVAADDDDVDELCENASSAVMLELIEREGVTEEDVDALMADVSRLLLTIRDLERVGDHAVNIAARTLYMIENNDELIY
ncbi:phosphate signaling complex protein PhoU [Halobaculum marinum]|uniref:Phosphate-specific transport system accessory protein PhoU n=1 Tax=Halobaculum marinum TaxID=3031996 RepID=A0ABD5WT63_9EURY|nr:phosphate signaling complex protein PhoU [Halobaculum sp. DT55]